MRSIVIAVALLAASSSNVVEAAHLRLEPVSLPAYSDIPHASLYAPSDQYRAAAADKRFAMRVFSYRSDGLVVKAYLYGPRSPTKKLPVIIFNRGSFTWSGFAGELLTMAHRLASRGYVVVAPMYRGSGGAAGRDEMGGADLDDLMNLKPVLADIPGTDPSHIFLYGESRGGMMVYQALRDGFPARSAAVVGAFTDLEAMLANPRWAQAGAQIWPDLATNRAAIVLRRSAIRWPEKINVPILIIHGAEDHEVPPQQSLRMTDELLRLKKPVQLVVVDGADHVISNDPAGRDEWVLDWFARR